MRKLNFKIAVLGAVIALGGASCLFAQTPQPVGQPKKVICIVETDTAVVGVVGNVEWATETEGPDGAKSKVRKVIVINSEEGPAHGGMGTPEEEVILLGEPGDGKGERVIVHKNVLAGPGANGKAKVHTIRIVNGDTVTNNITEDEIGEGMLIRDGAGPGEQVNVEVKDDGNGHQIIMVHIRAVKITDLKGEEASKFAPRKGEELGVKDLAYFPNPNQGRFTLNFRLRDKATPAEIRISGLDGKEIFRDNAQGAEGRYERQIDLGDVAAGTYLLTITQGTQNAVKRIVME